MKRDLSAPVVSRRSLLVHGASTLGVAGAFGAFAATGCKKAPSFCNDVTGLTADNQSARTTLGYEDNSQEPGKICSKCSQYVEPPELDQCARCKVLPGPVHPNGYCRVYTPRS